MLASDDRSAPRINGSERIARGIGFARISTLQMSEKATPKSAVMVSFAKDV
jgi:hypothetical protein